MKLQPAKSIYTEQSDYMFKGDNAYKFQNDDEMYQLELYIENDGELYKRQLMPTIESIQKKIKSGRYDHKLAPKAWLYLVEAGAKKFAPEYLEYNELSPSIKWTFLFPKSDREVLAQKFADYYYDEIMRGNYD